MMPKLFVRELFDDDNNSLGWTLSSGYHPRDVEVIPKPKQQPSERFTDIPPWVLNG